MADPQVHAVFAGLLQRDFLLTPDGKAFNDVLGGNAIYAAAGWKVWNKELKPGLLARVGADFPRPWLEAIQKQDIDIRGVKIETQAVDVRAFYAYQSFELYSNSEAVSHYAQRRLPFPKALFGYQPPATQQDSRTRTQPTSLRSTDIPPEYLDSTTAHVGPLDFLTHNLIPSLLRQGTITTVTLAPSPGYMNPVFWSDIPRLLLGITAFLPTENDLRRLFKERSQDLWEMAEALGEYGCEIIVIRKTEQGQMVYDAINRKRWYIPPYPARIVSLHGAGDVFCGGFLAGFRQTYDPLEAALFGNIAASIACEGHGPFYALDAEPRLAPARLDSLRQAVRKL